MTTFRFHTSLRQPPDEVWTVLTDVDKIPEWFPGVTNATYDGTFRHLQIADGSTLRARVMTHDDDLHRFQYSFVDGFPVPIDFHLGTLDVLAQGEGSLVIYSQEILPEALAPHVGNAVQAGIHGIRDYFESPGGPAC